MFKSFADAPFDELPEIEEFRSHALQVTETISVAISSLDDLETLALVLKDLGQAHSPQGLQDAHFDVSFVATFLSFKTVGSFMLFTLGPASSDWLEPGRIVRKMLENWTVVVWNHTGKDEAIALTDLLTSSFLYITCMRAAWGLDSPNPHCHQSTLSSIPSFSHSSAFVGKALILTLEAGLGEKFTPEVKEAYATFYGIVTKNMKEGLNSTE